MSDDRKHAISSMFFQTELIRELEAENKALREGRGVKVRPLEWVEHGEGLLCRCQIGEYQVYPTANDRNNKHVVYFVCAKRKSRIVGYCGGKEAAKSAAQADYERCILAALSLAPVSDAEPMHDDAPAAIIGEIGNQIHNLGCEHQNDEELRERLSDLASRTWKAARIVSTKTPAPVSVPEAAQLARDVVAMIDTMTDTAMRIGLTGTSDWDQLAGTVDIYEIQDRARALSEGEG